MNLENLEKNLQYKFKDINLLKQALTHSSFAYENKVRSNEKLEFLGDSILEFVSSEYIYKKYPKLTEGEMTKVRASVVCGESLSKVARKNNVGEFLYLGKSEKISGGQNRKAVLEDAVEAIIAAIYLDGGIESAKKFIFDNLEEEIDKATKHVGVKDYKTVLQEILQKNGTVNIEYEITNEQGPDHDKTFYAQVKLDGKVLAKGEGKSKKVAEMHAAQKALQEMED